MADALKDQGNKAFQAKDYDKAIDLFSQAIALDPTNFVLFSNRSAAQAGKRQYAAALEDAEQVCTIHDECGDQPLTRRSVVYLGQPRLAERLRTEGCSSPRSAPLR